MQHAESNKRLLSTLVAEQIEQTFGFNAHIIILTLAEFEQAVANNPYPEAQSEPKTLHMFFIAEPTTLENLMF